MIISECVSNVNIRLADWVNNMDYILFYFINNTINIFKQQNQNFVISHIKSYLICILCN